MYQGRYEVKASSRLPCGTPGTQSILDIIIDGPDHNVQNDFEDLSLHWTGRDHTFWGIHSGYDTDRYPKIRSLYRKGEGP